MKPTILSFFIILNLSLHSYSQFAPPAGQIGSTAIPADSICFISWANQCTIHRGHVNISDTSFEYNGSNYASYGEENWAIGPADNQVVSLGDSGFAMLEFNPPIANGLGWDFAVFENSLNDSFLEFAFVEISSDGIHYFRFPATSLTQTETQTGAFGITDATKINNLAGKYRALFGTPFNLDEISDNILLDKNSIRFVKILDVVGSINSQYASMDSYGNIINDPWPNPFNTCGFDLDAIGVINNTENTLVWENYSKEINLFPNPNSSQILNISSNEIINNIQFYSIDGKLLKKIALNGTSNSSINIEFLPKGLYFIKIEFNETSVARLFIRQ